MARPKKPIDLELLKKLASMFCTREEIAALLGVSRRTLQRNPDFARAYRQGQNSGKITVRRAQVQKALAGDTTMLIWLGKTILGQFEKTRTEAIVKAPNITITADDAALFEREFLDERVSDV